MMTIQNIIFYAACFGFGAGVLLRSLFRINIYAALLIGLISLFLSLFFSLVSKKRRGIIISVFALAFSIGIARFHVADKPAPEIFQNQIGQKISFSGVISDNPDKKENNIQLTVIAQTNGATTKLLLFTENNQDYRYGDAVRVAGKLETPKNFLTPQNKEFDYVNYLKKDGIFFVMRRPEIEIISRGEGNFIKRFLFSAEEKLASALNAAMPEPESLVMRALILGERSSFSQSMRQDFINTGLIHVVTISGYHVTLVAEWIMKIFGFLPANLAIGAGIIAVFFYVVMTGGAQTAIRAGIMAALALLARSQSRLYDSGRALILAAVLMIFVNPFILAFDVSFQLSFLATVAVIFLTPNMEQYFLWIPWKRFRNIVSLTSAAYLFVLPFILYQMGNWSLVALPANLAVLPLIPATMIFGFITGFAGLVSRLLAFIPGTIAYWLLRWELFAIGFFSGLPFASLSIPDFPFAIVLLTYAIFLYYLFAPTPKFLLRGAAKTELPHVNFNATGAAGKKNSNRHYVILIAALFLVISTAGFLARKHYESNLRAKENLQTLLGSEPTENPPQPFVPEPRTKSGGCVPRNFLSDQACTPGAVFQNATADAICFRGYTKTVRNVPTNLRKKVYGEYGVPYPQPRGAYEVDHLIPLALGGSNDIANLWTEAAEPVPGFHEKDLVEVYLQEEVCGGRVALPSAQKQIAENWLAIYNNLSPEQIAALKQKYGGR
ncbi:ComEC/Rec2 family competence protein [Patescibacteria group bacterium]|nr:ComEC/Rec2 family competence protein [Patescibacteria group bacterium]